MEEELLMCEYWALEEYLKGSNGTYIAPADKLPKIYFLPVLVGWLDLAIHKDILLVERKK